MTMFFPGLQAELTKEECEEFQSEILSQRPPRSRLECVEEEIARQQS